MPFDHFGFIAPLYNRRNNYSSLEMMLEAGDFPSDGRLLDVGGGTGRVALALRGHAIRIIVSDPSFEMLKFAASKPGLQVAEAFSERLPFHDDYFERVIMVDTLHHVVDQKETAHELLRVLKPGGRIIIEEPDIRTRSAKLVALFEKLLLMRSHFLSPDQIAGLFSPRKTRIVTKDFNSWVVIEK